MSESKTILITGATSGIGRETARYLHELGYRLVLTGRDAERLSAVADELNGQVSYVLNLERLEEIPGLFAFLQEKQIRLDGMVHAAGIASCMPVRCNQFGTTDKEMKLHYYAFLELCKQFYSRKISNDGSSIVALSSISCYTKRKGYVPYVASKAAMNAAVSITSKEFLKRSIRVNALMPAYVDTRMNDGLEELIDIQTAQPMGLIPPREIAYAIAFLLSDQSRFITGSFLPISGGMEF